MFEINAQIISDNKSPALQQLLQQRIDEEKLQVGRAYLSGDFDQMLVHLNKTSYFNKALINFREAN